MQPHVEALLDEPITWKEALAGEREKEYFKNLIAFVERERASGKRIYPQNTDVFNALAHTPFADVKVVVIGQDPYHGANQAHGLSFSVRAGVAPPPSLVNIFKELHADLGIARPSHGCLEAWARQGVLLLNAVLSVEEGKPGSHGNIGWEQFTDRVIQELNDKRSGLVFLLWGAYAQKKGERIDATRHAVLKAPHPSPFSANRGFLGCKHFSKANDLLAEFGKGPVDWRL